MGGSRRDGALSRRREADEPRRENDDAIEQVAEDEGRPEGVELSYDGWLVVGARGGGRPPTGQLTAGRRRRGLIDEILRRITRVITV